MRGIDLHSLCLRQSHLRFAQTGATISTPAFEVFPPTKVTAQLNDDCSKLAMLKIVIGSEEHVIPDAALKAIDVPDLSSIRVEAEQGRGGLWTSVVFDSAVREKMPTRFRLTIINGKYAHTSKIVTNIDDLVKSEREITLHKATEK